MNDGDEVVSLPRERAKGESLLKFISPFTMCIIGKTTTFLILFSFSMQNFLHVIRSQRKYNV